MEYWNDGLVGKNLLKSYGFRVASYEFIDAWALVDRSLEAG
jgi:hypothetical protein